MAVGRICYGVKEVVASHDGLSRIFKGSTLHIHLSASVETSVIEKQ